MRNPSFIGHLCKGLKYINIWNLTQFRTTLLCMNAVFASWPGFSINLFDERLRKNVYNPRCKNVSQQTSVVWSKLCISPGFQIWMGKRNLLKWCQDTDAAFNLVSIIDDYHCRCCSQIEINDNLESITLSRWFMKSWKVVRWNFYHSCLTTQGLFG